MQQQLSNGSSSNQSKLGNEKLKKSVDGNNYVKWLERLKEDFASNSASCVKQYGPDLLRDQRGWIERYRAEYAASDDIEKSALSRKKSERQNAIEIVYNLILSRLSEEVKQLVEAELVALSDMASMVLWVSMFMMDLGFKCGVPIIYQDNMSTMKVAEKGLTNNPNTKHIDIRQLWITEVLKNGSLKLEYKRTDEMLADGMTKPLVGEKFYKFVKDLNIV